MKVVLFLLVTSAIALPYIDIEGNFYVNYTGMCTGAEPSVGFACTEDSLDMDSLLLIYPTVSVMDSVVYGRFVEMKMGE